MRCIRCAHEYDNFQQASIIDHATSILGYRSRFLPRVSPRAPTLTQLDTLALAGLGGVSGLRMLHGPNRTSAKNVRGGSDKLKQDKIIKGADMSTHTTDDATTPFPSGCSLLMVRIQDDWCQITKVSPRPRAWRGKGWIRSLSTAGWSANSGCDFGSSLTNSFFFDPRYTGGPQTTKINLNRHRSGPRTLISVRGSLKLPVAALSILHPLMGTGWELQIIAT